MSEQMTYPKSYVYNQLGNKPRGNLYYLKYEADKVISNLKAKIALLKDDNAELRKENESLKYSVATLDTDLAMATRWRMVSKDFPNADEGYFWVMWEA